MKIGTDGVLLGAWAGAENPRNILDIGTGTGLIVLMLAQRFSKSHLTAIEIDESAFLEALTNVSESIFNDRCRVFLSSLQDFDSDKKFDLIVSNPPFFELTHREISSRNTARQQSDLTFEELLTHSKRLLTTDGKIGLIVPFGSEKELICLGKNLNLFPLKIMRVRGNGNSPYKRSLILFSSKIADTEIRELTIEISRNLYTDDYIALTKDFYLKM